MLPFSNEDVLFFVHRAHEDELNSNELRSLYRISFLSFCIYVMHHFPGHLLNYMFRSNLGKSSPFPIMSLCGYNYAETAFKTCYYLRSKNLCTKGLKNLSVVCFLFRLQNKQVNFIRFSTVELEFETPGLESSEN